MPLRPVRGVLRAVLRAGLAAWCLAGGGGAQALVVHSDGTYDPTVAPPESIDPGWDRVGRFGAGSAVFLGTNDSGEPWILTADHVGAPGTFTLDGVDYTTDISAGFTNPEGGSADLRAWRLTSDPGLGDLVLSGTTPAPGSIVISIGTGRSDGAFTCWDANWNTTACGGAAHQGYVWDPRARQWGANSTVDVGDVGSDDPLFATGFGSADTVVESQAATGDSGGGTFVFDPDVDAWVLAGLMHSIGWASDPARPASGVAALDEDFTFHVDLSFYRDQIATATGLVAIPEPAPSALIALGLAALAARRRTARRGGVEPQEPAIRG